MPDFGRRLWLGLMLAVVTMPGPGVQPIAAGQPTGAAAVASALDAMIADGRLDAGVLQSLRRGGRADAIVTYNRPTGGSASDVGVIATWKASTLSQLRRNDALLADHSALLTSYARFTTPELLLAVLRERAVSGVRANRAMRPSDVEANGLIRQPQAVAAGYRGAGTSVAVLDTGADYRREALGSCTAPGKPASCRVVVARDFAPSDHQRDDVGHGTAVSEVVASVAPGASILALDVFRGDGLAYDSDLLEAIDWLVRNRETWNVRAINLSLADPTHWLVECPLSGLEPAFDAAQDAGMVVSVASGNSAAAVGAYVDGIAYPACVPGALSVGAVYDANVGPTSYDGCSDAHTAADQVACFSQGGSQLDLLAPGALISAAGLQWSGTSLAAPHVSAAAAVLAGAAPRATPERIAYVLRNNGPSIADERSGTRRHRLDLFLAARLIRDAQRPSLTSRAPASGASGVARSAAVVATFSENVRGVGTASMILRDAHGAEVPASVTYDAGRHRATLRPSTALDAHATYAVILTAAIRDAAGNRLRATSWSFATGG
jgi:subtilisin family serine protease